MNKITKKEIIQLAHKYYFDINEDQVESLFKEFNLIFKKIDIFKKFNLKNLQPSFLPIYAKNDYLRSDDQIQNESSKKLIQSEDIFNENNFIIIGNKDKDSEK